jgi:hypothetical protein
VYRWWLGLCRYLFVGVVRWECGQAAAVRLGTLAPGGFACQDSAHWPALDELNTTLWEFRGNWPEAEVRHREQTGGVIGAGRGGRR